LQLLQLRQWHHPLALLCTAILLLLMLMIILLLHKMWLLLASSDAVGEVLLLQLLQLLPAGAAAVVEGLVAPWRGVQLLLSQQQQQRHTPESFHAKRCIMTHPTEETHQHCCYSCTAATAALLLQLLLSCSCMPVMLPPFTMHKSLLRCTRSDAQCNCPATCCILCLLRLLPF
jgi:hypothetical protein